MVQKNQSKFYIFIIITLLLNLAFVYYISVHTVFAQKELPKVENSSNTLGLAVPNASLEKDEVDRKLKAVFGENFDPDEIVEMKIEDDSSYGWSIKDYSRLREVINEYKLGYDLEPSGGVSELVDGKLFLFEAYLPGRSVDVEKSVERVENWLGATHGNLSLAVRSYDWQDIQKHEIYDFSKEVGVGKSRIDLIRNGAVNFGVFNAEVGLLEIHNVVVMPGEEFSYVENLGIQPNGRTLDGRTVGGGICNATTTLYRAALESGLEIVDSQRHTFYVESYEWGYPLNVVDAAYFLNPRVDLVLKNSYDYPIVFRISTQKKLDGYQYHYVNVRTSNLAESRRIELTDWTRTNSDSSEYTSGYFTRNIYVGNKLVKSEVFGR